MSKRAKGSEADEQLAMLGTFAPQKRQKQDKAKKKSQQKKNDERFYMHKRFAIDSFNTSLTPNEYQLWASAFTPTMTLREYEQTYCSIDMSDITYQSLLSHSRRAAAANDVDGISERGFLAISDFVYCAEYMSQWQEQWMRKLGWAVNPTGYDISTVSHSSAELMDSGLEWLRMLCKLSCRMMECTSSSC